MAVLMVSEVEGQTRQGYDQVLNTVRDAVLRAPGFVMHGAHPVEGGWRLMEVWRSKEDCDRFFVEHVVPYLPPGVRPKRAYQELHSLVMPNADNA